MKCVECPQYKECSSNNDLKKKRQRCSVAMGERWAARGVKNLCKLFSCSATMQNSCCAHCSLRPRCEDACLNDPERCGQATMVASVTTKGFVTAHIKKEIK